MLLKFAQDVSIQVKTIGGSPQLQSKTVTPSSTIQYITPNAGYDGLSQVIVNGDSNLISSNIKNNVNIFGVMGSLISKVTYLKYDQSFTVTNSKKIYIPYSNNAVSIFAVMLNFPQYDSTQRTVVGGSFFYNRNTNDFFSGCSFWITDSTLYYSDRMFYLGGIDDSTITIGLDSNEQAQFFVGYTCKYNIMAISS